VEGRAVGLLSAQDALQPLHTLEPAGVCDRIFAGLAGDGPKPKRIMIDATHLKAPSRCGEPAEKGDIPRRIERTKGG
jgi:hypothetical protein